MVYLICLALSAAAAGGPTTDHYTIQPIDAWQTALDDFAKTRTDSEMLRSAADLAELSALQDGGRCAIQQVALWLSRHHNEADRAHIATLKLWFFREFRLGLVLSALDDQLETSDEQMRGAVSFLLSFPPERELSGEYSFRDVVSYRDGHKAKPLPPTLVTMMFRNDPTAAFNTLSRIGFFEKDISLETQARLKSVQHVVADAVCDAVTGLPRQPAKPEAVAAITELSKSDQWWCRLYAARIMGSYEMLRIAKDLERLKRDEDPNVRACAKIYSQRSKASNVEPLEPAGAGAGAAAASATGPAGRR